MLRRPVIHNGTESRDLLPLRKGNAKDNAAQKGYSEGNGDMRLPQRHRIAEFAAVAVRDAKDNAAQKGFSEGNGDM